jgi:hypothetical protein
VERRVEYRDLGQVGSALARDLDPDQIGWIVERRQAREISDHRQDVVVDSRGLEKGFATMYDTMSDSRETLAVGQNTRLAQDRHDSVDGHAMVGHWSVRIDLFGPIEFPVNETAPSFTDSFRGPPRKHTAVAHLEELVLDRRAA